MRNSIATQLTHDGSPSAVALSRAAEAVAAALRADESTLSAIRSLLQEAEHPDDRSALIARSRFVDLLCDSRVLEEALVSALIDTTARDHAIRNFFLEPRETYTLADLAHLWQVQLDDVEAIFLDEICASDTATGAFTVRWADALGAALAYSVFRPAEIERALGDDFGRARSDEWRIRPLYIALPQWLVAEIENEPVVPQTLDLPARVEQLLLLIMRGRGGTPWR